MRWQLAMVIAAREPERLYSALSVLVSSASAGASCAGLATFGALELLLEPDLLRRAQETDATPSLAWAGRERFALSLVELRDLAGEIEGLELFACSASVDAMGLEAAAVEERVGPITSTPRFLEAAGDARLLFA